MLLQIKSNINNGLLFPFPFTKMPDTILLRKDLKKLMFWNQKNLDIPHLFNLLLKIPDLEELEIVNTNINGLSEELLSMKKLKKIKFRDKQVEQFFGGKKKEELGGIFENLEHLELIFEQEVDDVSGILDGALFPKLKVLSLVNIPISACKNLGKLTKLETLSINKGGIQEIPIELNQLENLKKINFENNEIEYLPKEFLRLPELSELYLKANQIKEFPIAYFRDKDFFNKKLVLDISFNNIETFPMNLFEFERRNGWEVKILNNKIMAVPENLPDLFKVDSDYNLGIYRFQIGKINGEIVALARDWQNVYKKINFYG